MRLLIGGCRGTHSVAQRAFLGYGGETTSFLIEGSDGAHVMVDAGTGIRVLGAHLAGLHDQGGSALVLMSHYHLDHTMGLPSLSQIYDKRWQFEFASPDREGHSVSEVLPRLLDEPFWPLQVEHLAAHVRFLCLPGALSAQAWPRGGLRIRWCPVPHPGGCTAYRVDEPASGRSVVIATDMEWPAATPEGIAAFLHLCRDPNPASLLVMDGQYDRASYEAHRGWGHSAWEDGVEVAERAGVERLLITHHDPALDDEQLAERERRVLLAWPQASLAREGMSILV